MPTYGADRYVLVLKMTYNKNAAESVKLEFAAVCHINIKSRQRHKDVFVGNKSVNNFSLFTTNLVLFTVNSLKKGKKAGNNLLR